MITFALLKALPDEKNWWETYWEKISIEEYGIYGAEPTWDFFVDVERNNTTLLITMETST
jgi:hypothetical protein